MNTSRTDHEAYQWEMPRAELRQMLIDAQHHCARCGHYHAYRACFACDCTLYVEHRKVPYHYDLHEAPASLWECVGWTLFAAAMLAVLAYSILFAIGCNSIPRPDIPSYTALTIRDSIPFQGDEEHADFDTTSIVCTCCTSGAGSGEAGYRWTTIK